MRRLVGLTMVLGVLGIGGGSQVAVAAPITNPAVKLCNQEQGTFATFSDPVTFQAGYTCAKTKSFSTKQVLLQENVCFNDEGGLSFAVVPPGGVVNEPTVFCYQRL